VRIKWSHIGFVVGQRGRARSRCWRQKEQACIIQDEPCCSGLESQTDQKTVKEELFHIFHSQY
jgi:hypothetical protein